MSPAEVVVRVHVPLPACAVTVKPVMAHGPEIAAFTGRLETDVAAKVTVLPLRITIPEPAGTEVDTPGIAKAMRSASRTALTSIVCDADPAGVVAPPG